MKNIYIEPDCKYIVDNKDRSIMIEFKCKDCKQNLNPVFLKSGSFENFQCIDCYDDQLDVEFEEEKKAGTWPASFETGCYSTGGSIVKNNRFLIKKHRTKQLISSMGSSLVDLVLMTSSMALTAYLVQLIIQSS